MKKINFLVQIVNFDIQEINCVKADYEYLILNLDTLVSRSFVFKNEKKNKFYYSKDLQPDKFPWPELKKNEEIKSLYIRILK